MPRKPTVDIAVLESPTELDAAPSFALVAKACYVESGNDIDAALPALIAAVMADPALIPDAVAFACKEQLNYTQRLVRHSMWRASERETSAPVPSKPPSDEGLRRLAEQNLLDFPLPGGLPLRAAFPEDLRSAITRYRAQAKGSILNAHWLGLVLNRTPHDTPVGAVLQHGDLQRLQHEARQFVEGAAPEAVTANSAAHTPERSAA